MTTQAVALVTGASSGFGTLIAASLVESGYTVYGTSRRPRNATAGQVRMRALDVTSAESVEQCVAGILAEVGRIDLLVNNAGGTISAPVEETAITDAEALFQTNFFGAARLTARVLPYMRAQGKGTIMFISSLAGLVGTPGQAYYSASKHALEGYAETLRVEVAEFGINVVLVEPGFFRTAIHASAATSHGPKLEAYSRLRQALDRNFARAIEQGDDPQKVARLIAKIAATPKPRLRYRVGNDAIWVPRFKKLLPESWFLGVMQQRFSGGQNK